MKKPKKPVEPMRNKENLYMQQRQKVAAEAGMRLCKCGGLIWDCGRCGDCGRTEGESHGY